MLAAATTAIALTQPGPALASGSLELEAGLVLPGKNDVAVPGNTGSRFSLTDDLDADRAGAFRLRYGHQFGERHWIAVLAAPLTVQSQGSFDDDITFNGRQFAAGQPVQARFRFDSYRLIYRYRWLQTDALRVSIGAALKLRDASIRLSSGDTRSEKSNTGLVPLLSFDLNWRLRDRLSLLIDGEALAAPQGRAEDVLLAIHHTANDRLSFRLGYRVLEGGADNEAVYSFSLFHFLVGGVIWSW